MPRTPEELFKEVAAWPLEERLRLAARILEAGAAELREGTSAGRPAGGSGAPRPSGGEGEEHSSTHHARDASNPAPARSAAASGAVSPLSRSEGPEARGPTAPTSTPGPRRLVVLDGSNFLGTVPGFDLVTDAPREELILRLQEFAHAHPAFSIVAYFDGQKTTVRRFGRLEIRFTSGQRPADYYILELLRGLGAAERGHALLVTADRALADAAHKLGAKIEAPSSFHRRLPGAARKSIGERGLSASEVADWEAYFQRPPEEKRKKP